MYRFGPPLGDYPNFNLPMGRSHGFASAPPSSRPIQTRFRCASGPEGLILARQEQLVGSLCKRHAVIPATPGLRPLVSARFQVLFTPLLAVLFTFPSRYWFTIGLSGVFSLGGWSPHLRTGFHVSRLTRNNSYKHSSYGAVTLFGAAFQAASVILITALGLVPVRSPLLGESRLISFPPGT